MPLTDEQKKETVWVAKGRATSIYHTEQRIPESEFYVMTRGDAEALNLKLCTRCSG